MKKQLKLSYKIYANTRLQNVTFHGQVTAPLYIQLIYNKKPVYFKSSYFDQLSSPKYAIQSILGYHAPVVSQVIGLEEELLEYLCKKQTDNIDVDALKANYYLLSRDLLFHLEEGFQRYLTTFFQDEGLPVLAFLIFEGGKKSTAEQILNDLKISIDKHLFKKLLENATHYAPPYIPLCAFLRTNKKQLVPLLPVLEWSSVEFKNNFKTFLGANFIEYNFAQIDQYLNKLIKSFQ